MAYGYVGYQRTFRIREFYALLAFLVGISIGFILTTRTRIQIVAPDVEAIRLASADGGEKVSCGGGQSRIRQARSSEDVWPAEQSAAVVDDEDLVDGQMSLKVVNENRRKLIFVGVMTAQKYLDTRAMAVHRTWANHLDGRVVFFAAADAEVPAGLPVVRLAGVDDTYPPQKKSFLMLKYMYEQFGDDYEWFMRADDDVYVRGDRLETFLRSINSSLPQFIGQAGMGNKEEFGQLNLERDENFCMGGPGIVFSRETLRRVAPNVRHCLRNLYSTHEDVEVGRCVRRFAEIPCTWSYEMQRIFYHNNSGDEAFAGNLKQKEVHRAITLHPIKQHTHLYRLHKYMLSLTIQDLLQKTIVHYRDMRAMMTILGMSSVNATSTRPRPNSTSSVEKDNYELATADLLGRSPGLTKSYPSDDSRVVKWDFIQHTIYSHARSNPRRKLETSLREVLDDVSVHIMDQINRFSKQRGRIIDFKELLYGYHRFDPEHGADYVLDMILVYKKYRGRKMTIPVRKHVYVQQAFTDLEVREAMRPVTPSGRPEIVNFILPLAGRFHIFLRFMRNFEATCLIPKERVSLTVIVFSDNNNGTSGTASMSITDRVVALVQEFQTRYADSAAIVLHVMDGPFSRAKALQKGAADLPDSALLFFVDVDMYFTRECVNRLRLNTIRGKQVYFPIVFSQYDPIFHPSSSSSSPTDAIGAIENELGYWRQFGFGIVSIYNGDLNRTGGLDVSIQGWGKEDVDLYDKVVASNLTVFRAPDLGLVHIFHPMNCDPQLPAVQLHMCQGSRAGNYASVHKLASIFYADPKILSFISTDKSRLLSS